MMREHAYYCDEAADEIERLQKIEDRWEDAMSAAEDRRFDY